MIPSVKRSAAGLHPGCLWSLVGAAMGATVVVFGLALSGISRGPQTTLPTPILTVLARPTETPPPSPVPASAEQTSPTDAPILIPRQSGDFQIGDLVEVYGTSGEGLRMRDEPGLEGRINFLGVENEVFEIRDGPVEADGYTWWHLFNPYDETKQGWAAGGFLRSLNAP